MFEQAEKGQSRDDTEKLIVEKYLGLYEYNFVSKS